MDVACVGILVADVFASPIPRLPDEGELTTTSGFVTSVGGCAANVAVALRILGREVAVAGKVGTDMFGDFVIADLQRHGIGVEHVRRTSRPLDVRDGDLHGEGQKTGAICTALARTPISRWTDVDYSLLDNVRVLYVGGYLAMPGFAPAQLARLVRRRRSRRDLPRCSTWSCPRAVVFRIRAGCRRSPVHRLFPAQPGRSGPVDRLFRSAGAGGMSQLQRIRTCAVVITRGPHGCIDETRRPNHRNTALPNGYRGRVRRRRCIHGRPDHRLA